MHSDVVFVCVCLCGSVLRLYKLKGVCLCICVCVYTHIYTDTYIYSCVMILAAIYCFTTVGQSKTFVITDLQYWPDYFGEACHIKQDRQLFTKRV